MLMNNSTIGIGSLRKLSPQTVATDRTNISIGAPCHRDYRGAVIDYSKVENVRKSREQVSSRWSLKSGEKLTVGDYRDRSRGIYNPALSIDPFGGLLSFLSLYAFSTRSLQIRIVIERYLDAPRATSPNQFLITIIIMLITYI